MALTLPGFGILERRFRTVAAAGLLLLAPLVAQANEEAKPAPPGAQPSSRASTPRDELFFVGGSREEWSVSKSNVGCLLLSPWRSAGIRIALGRHATYGLGLMLIGLGLSTPVDNPNAPIVIAAGGRDLKRTGRVVARDIVFVPLSRDDLELSLRELWYAETLWVTVQETALSQGGHAIKQAVESYSHTCKISEGAPS